MNHEDSDAHGYLFHDGKLAIMKDGTRRNESYHRTECSRNHEDLPGVPGVDSGNRARLLAASLSVARPDRFDVKCHELNPSRNFSCVPDKATRGS